MEQNLCPLSIMSGKYSICDPRCKFLSETGECYVVQLIKKMATES